MFKMLQERQASRDRILAFAAAFELYSKSKSPSEVQDERNERPPTLSKLSYAPEGFRAISEHNCRRQIRISLVNL